MSDTNQRKGARDVPEGVNAMNSLQDVSEERGDHGQYEGAGDNFTVSN
jgi:hypothetical protein